MIDEKLNNIKIQFEKDLESLDSKNLDEIKVKYLGRKSELMDILSNIRFLEPEERKVVRNKANVLRKEIESLIDERKLGVA